MSRLFAILLAAARASAFVSSRKMSRLFGILLAAAPASAFVETWRAYDQPQYAFTWQFPLLKNDTAGLGAGLTYAIHPTFCDRIIQTRAVRLRQASPSRAGGRRGRPSSASAEGLVGSEATTFSEKVLKV